jgi:hypothetical protein
MTSSHGAEVYDELPFDVTDGTIPSVLASDRYGLELQRMWLSAQALEWKSLALVPASDDVGVIQLAYAFSELALWNCGESIGVADLRDIPFSSLKGPIEIINGHIHRGKRVIIALRSCVGSIATAPIVRAADCAILCVALGATRIAQANDALEQVGRDHFIGTLLVRPPCSDTGAGVASMVPRLRV